MFVVQLSREQWAKHSELAHLIVFNKRKPASMDRIDFALVAQKDDALISYVTCREHDAETLYWQFGGAFPGTKNTSLSFQAYQMGINWCKEKGYKRVTTAVENTNIVMLKFALKVGFLIVGIRNHHGSVLVELVLEF